MMVVVAVVGECLHGLHIIMRRDFGENEWYNIIVGNISPRRYAAVMSCGLN